MRPMTKIPRSYRSSTSSRRAGRWRASLVMRRSAGSGCTGRAASASCPGGRAELIEVATGEHAKDSSRVSPLILLAALWSAPPSPSPPERPDVQRPSQLHLGWTGPDACPDADEVRERLRARLPTIEDPLPRGVVPLAVEVSLAAVDA